MTNEGFGDGEFGDGPFGGGTLHDDALEDTDSHDDLSRIGLETAETEQASEQELVDLKVARTDIQLTEGHDLAMVSGMENVKQSVALDIRDVAHFHVGDTLTSNTVFDVTAQIERSLNADPQIVGPTRVVVESVDPEANTINFTITTHDNDNFDLEIVVPE